MASDAAEPPGAEAGRFAVAVKPGPADTVLALSGELDHDTADALRDALDVALATAPARVLVDFADVRFCDSSGLNVLLRGRLAALEVGSAIELSALRPPVARMFELTGASSVFPTHATLDEALAPQS